LIIPKRIPDCTKCLRGEHAARVSRVWDPWFRVCFGWYFPFR